MMHEKTPLKTIARWMTPLVALAFTAGTASAAVLGPYTADANTLLLYNFDETSGVSDPGTPFDNAGTLGATYDLTNTGGPDGRDNTGGGGYGEAAYTGFGSAFNVYNSGDGTRHTGVPGASDGGGAHTGNTFAQTTLQAANGAFTYEALIKSDDINNEHQILSRDTSSGTRGFVFFIISGELRLVREGGGGFVAADIPTIGDNAFAADTWFHVAVTYTGEAGADNTKLYWTIVDDAATEANLIGMGSLSADLANATTDLYVGSSARSPYRFELQAIDEVRVSNVVRGADEFIFGEIIIPAPAALPAGLAMFGLAATRRRRR